jgi:hypothetical protein
MIRPYKRDGYEVIRKGDLVYKKASCLDDNWRAKMEQILDLWPLPAFDSFIDGGYVTKYIPGTDLHGTQAFMLDGSCGPCILEGEDRFGIIPIFSDAMHVGDSLGFTFGDITMGNILVSNRQFYLIDYDSIVSYPLSSSTQDVWEMTFRMVFSVKGV